PTSSGPLIGEFGSATSSAARIILIITATSAQIRPFFSIGSSFCMLSTSSDDISSSCSLDIVNVPRRGSTILDDTNQPTNVSKNTLTMIKYQFIATLIESA